MQHIPSIEEQKLSKLAPAPLDHGFLARLTACAEGTSTELTAEETDFEASLRHLKPRTIPATLSATLLTTLSEAPFAVDDKIVLFNGKGRPSTAQGKRKILSFHIAAAAAVALLGTITALMLPSHTGTSPLTASPAGSPPPSLEEVSVPYIPPSDNTTIAAASFDTRLSESKDHGVIWKSAFQPQRIMRFTYTDEVTVENEHGQKMNVKLPRIEYVIIPEKVD